MSGEAPIKFFCTNYSCHNVPILLAHAVIERPCRLSCDLDKNGQNKIMPLRRVTQTLVPNGQPVLIILWTRRQSKSSPARSAACQTGCLYVLEYVAVAADAAAGCC